MFVFIYSYISIYRFLDAITRLGCKFTIGGYYKATFVEQMNEAVVTQGYITYIKPSMVNFPEEVTRLQYKPQFNTRLVLFNMIHDDEKTNNNQLKQCFFFNSKHNQQQSTRENPGRNQVS